MLDLLWLELAAALSFSTDGQQMLLKADGTFCCFLFWLFSVRAGRDSELYSVGFVG
jgi:hypothetical protein